MVWVKLIKWSAGHGGKTEKPEVDSEAPKTHPTIKKLVLVWNGLTTEINNNNNLTIKFEVLRLRNAVNLKTYIK